MQFTYLLWISFVVFYFFISNRWLWSIYVCLSPLSFPWGNYSVKGTCLSHDFPIHKYIMPSRGGTSRRGAVSNKWTVTAVVPARIQENLQSWVCKCKRHAKNLSLALNFWLADLWTQTFFRVITFIKLLTAFSPPNRVGYINKIRK